MHDGYSDGPVVGISEPGAQNYASGGNRFAARLVRAPLDALLSQRSIEVFQTAARGVRNPYGLTTDPAGRLWFTDNGASNVPDAISAGDEVNLFNPGAVPPGAADDATPYYGFPLALSGNPPDRCTKPMVGLPNSPRQRELPGPMGRFSTVNMDVILVCTGWGGRAMVSLSRNG